MINPSIDTDAIGKYIGNELYKISLQKNITQTDIAKKLGINQVSVSMLFTGKSATKNIERYWRIAEAIPISRKDFDQIVEDAKRKVIGDYGSQEVSDPLPFSLDSKLRGLTPTQQKMVDRFVSSIIDE